MQQPRGGNNITQGAMQRDAPVAIRELIVQLDVVPLAEAADGVVHAGHEGQLADHEEEEKGGDRTQEEAGPGLGPDAYGDDALVEGDGDPACGWFRR